MNKSKNFKFKQIIVYLFILGIGIKKIKDEIFMVIFKKKNKTIGLNNIFFLLSIKVLDIYNCPSQDISSFVELYIFSIFYPNKMNFYYKRFA